MNDNPIDISYHCLVDNDVLKDEPAIVEFKVKEAVKLVTKEADTLVNQYLTKYIWTNRINPFLDIMAITNQQGITFRDIKHDRDILFRSFINCETKDRPYDSIQTFKIKVEKLYG